MHLRVAKNITLKKPLH